MIGNSTLTAGRTFERIVFNDKYPSRNPITNEVLTPTPFHTTSQGFSGAPGRALPTLNLDRVYVLTGPGTCSASESIINGLRGVNVQVYVIGSTTCGKPYGFYPADNCGTTYFSIQFRGENAANFGDYTDGFSPANQPSPRHHAARLLRGRRLHASARRSDRGAHRRGARLPREQQPDLPDRNRYRAAAGVEVIFESEIDESLRVSKPAARLNRIVRRMGTEAAPL